MCRDVIFEVLYGADLQFNSVLLFNCLFFNIFHVL